MVAKVVMVEALNAQSMAHFEGLQTKSSCWHDCIWLANDTKFSLDEVLLARFGVKGFLPPIGKPKLFLDDKNTNNIQPQFAPIGFAEVDFEQSEDRGFNELREISYSR